MRSAKRKAPTPPPASIPDDVFDMQLSSPAQSLLMSIQNRRAQAQSKPAADLYHTLNPDLSVRVLRLLLAKQGYPDAEVLGSKIPLRL